MKKKLPTPPKKRSEKYKGKRHAMMIRVPEKTMRFLTEFSSLTGTSKNDFIVGVLTETVPHLQGIIEAVKEAKKTGGAGAMRTLSAAMSHTMSGLQTQASEAQYNLGLAAGQSKKHVLRSPP